MNQPGLTHTEAAQRLQQDGPNALPGSQPKGVAAIALEVLREPMFLMLLAAGGIYLLLGDRAEALFLLSAVFAIIGITFVQERKTERALEALRDLSAPRALVIRDGQEQRIPGREVVRGDLLVLHEGDRIAADGVLLEGRLSVDESLLTGESAAVDKTTAAGPVDMAEPGGEGPSPFVFAGSVVTQGIGLAEVRATGTHTAMGQIGKSLTQGAEARSPMQIHSQKLVRWLATLAVGVAVLQVLISWRWADLPLPQSILNGLALAMSVIPEEIPVVLTVFLAIGAWRLSQRQVLTRRIPAVEALGSITVLAVDKTGTLTQNRMTVAELQVDGQIFRDLDASLPEQAHALLKGAVLATPPRPHDPMDKALQVLGKQALAYEHLQSSEHHYALSAELLAVTHAYPDAQPGSYRLAAKGAVEAIIDLCHLPQESMREQVEDMARRGLRVLGVARGHYAGSAWPDHPHDLDFQFLGLIGFQDPPRPEVAAAMQECRQAGIRVIMMTGDHPATAAAIAAQIDLTASPDILTGKDIDQLDDATLAQRLQNTAICARLQPRHKLRLVEMLKRNGEVVAMTGDGVNDAPALKAAHIGIAMGGRGTDVAREAADLVLLDDSFASIVAAIRGGRRIYDNISRAIHFIFAVHVPIIGLALLPPLLQWPLLLMPVHLVLLEFLMDPACSVVFEGEPEQPDMMSRPPRPLSASPFNGSSVTYALAQGVGLLVILFALYATLQWWGWSAGAIRGTVFCGMALGLYGLVLANSATPYRALFQARPANPLTRYMLIIVLALLLAILSIPAINQFFRFGPPDLGQLLAILVSVSVMGLWLGWLRGRQTDKYSAYNN